MHRLAPRLFGIIARDVDVVAVIRRGPTEWCQISRWDLRSNELESGSWFRGTIPPQKCDLSPDGRWLLYSAVKYPGRWEVGSIYEAVSRLPWLKALAAWNSGTTYTRGAHFVDDADRTDLGEPDIGRFAPPNLGIAITPPAQFAVERRRGWTESEETPLRDDGDVWDTTRDVTMVKTRPGGGGELRVEGSFAAHRSSPQWHRGLLYSLHWPDEQQLLDAQWAEWSHDGHLLTANAAGSLCCHEVAGRTLNLLYQHDVSALEPDPQPPPPAASHW